MLIVILVVLVILTLISRRNKTLFKIFLAGTLAVVLLSYFLFAFYLSKEHGKPDLSECRKKREAAQEEMRELKKELIEKNSLNEEIVNQFLEDYEKSQNAFESYSTIIEENVGYLENGGRELIRALLFLGLK